MTVSDYFASGTDEQPTDPALSNGLVLSDLVAMEWDGDDGATYYLDLGEQAPTGYYTSWRQTDTIFVYTADSDLPTEMSGLIESDRQLLIDTFFPD